jgi:hypothetical protein
MAISEESPRTTTVLLHQNLPADAKFNHIFIIYFSNFHCSIFLTINPGSRISKQTITSQILNPTGLINGPVVGSSEHSMETYYLIEEAKI